MKKIFFLLVFSFLFIACVPALRQDSGEFFTLTPARTPQPTNTEFINYQPTIDYSLTQVGYAQMTADGALIISIQATDNQAERVQETIRFQQEQAVFTHEVAGWTATAALTSIPLTATAQNDMSTAIAVQQIIRMNEITQTAEAPDLTIRTVTANNYQKYSFIEFLIRYTTYIALCFFLFAISVYLIRKPKIVKQEVIVREVAPEFIYPVQDYNANKDAVVAVKERAETVFPAETKLVFPCTAEQLDELARKVITEGMSLAYDNFMGNESLFTRETYSPVYSFLQEHRLAKSTGIKNKGIILTDRDFGAINGRDILTGWLESRTLPKGFSTLGSETAEGSVTTPPLSSNDTKTDTSPSMGQLVPVGRVQVG